MSKKNYKYTIHGFQQDKLVENKLTNDDALVASVILSMYASSTMQSINVGGERYIWVSQRALHKYIPIVGSEKKLRRIIDGLVNKGLLKKETARSKDGKGGMYTFVMPTPLMGALTEYNHGATSVGQNDQEVVVKMSNGVLVKMSNGLWTKCPNKDTPNNNTPNSNTPNIYTEEKTPTQSVVESVREKNSKATIINQLLDAGLDKETAEEYWYFRTTIKKDRPTSRAVQTLINECERNNIPLSVAVSVMIERGWKGFRAEWYLKEQKTAVPQMTKREQLEQHNAVVVDSIKEKIMRGEL